MSHQPTSEFLFLFEANIRPIDLTFNPAEFNPDLPINDTITNLSHGSPCCSLQ